MTRREAMTEAAIVYRYFSYGSDSSAESRASARANESQLLDQLSARKTNQSLIRVTLSASFSPAVFM